MSADPSRLETAPTHAAGPSTSADPAPTSEDSEMAVPSDDEDNFHPPARPIYAEPHLPSNLFDDDDEIAHTLPIFISHALDPSIHLFQYPLNHRPIAVSQYAKEHGEVITARMKEQVRRLEIEIPVDQRAEVWNEERAETFGFAEEEEKDKKKSKGKSKEQEQTVWGTKMRLRGEEVPSVTGYWSGIVHDGALHLHPLSHLMQFRPSLGYLDAVDDQANRDRERARRAADGEDTEEEDDGPGGGAAPANRAGPSKAKKGNELKTVQVSVAQPPEETGLVRPASKMGTGGTVGSTHQIRAHLVAKIQKEKEDVWKPWRWDDVASSEVVNTLAHFLVPPERQATLECKTSPLDIISKQNIGEGARL